MPDEDEVMALFLSFLILAPHGFLSPLLVLFWNTFWHHFINFVSILAHFWSRWGFILVHGCFILLLVGMLFHNLQQKIVVASNKMKNARLYLSSPGPGAELAFTCGFRRAFGPTVRGDPFWMVLRSKGRTFNLLVGPLSPRNLASPNTQTPPPRPLGAPRPDF